MRLYEFTNARDYEDVDIFDDLQFFMMEDPTIYRTIYYPKVIELRKLNKASKKYDEDFFVPVIKKAISLYVAKFKVPKEIQQRFTDEGILNLSKSFLNSELSKGNDNGRESISGM